MGLIVSCFVFSLGVAFQVASTAIPLMGTLFHFQTTIQCGISNLTFNTAVGRLIAGFGVGLVSALSKLPSS